MAVNERRLSNGQTFRLSTETGTVLETNREQKLRIHQSAATVMSEGRVIPGPISSSTKTSQEVWIRTSTGREKSVRLDGFTVPVREGQLITVVSAAPAGNSHEVVFGLRNHTAEESTAYIAPMRAVVVDWALDVGAKASMLRWALEPGVAFGALVFCKLDPDRNRIPISLIAAAFAAAIGFSAWLNVGRGMGTQTRTENLLNEVRELGLLELARDPE